ncbi:MAG: nucleobase:cation symporter-2 family protein [Oscillospiraceae bacterium]|nr:nucleobase:cation symporter-2 family protein [Oscillospiraceae bacterium]
MKNPPHSTQALFQLNGIPPIGISLSMALQHLVAMIVGCVTPAIIIANVVGLPQAERVLLIQASLVMSAVTTLLELFPIGGKFGAGLPVMFGVSFAYLPSMQSIAAGGGGIASIAGAMIVGGVIAMIVGIFVKKIRKLFPPVITGTVVFTIGLSLYPTAIHYMAGGSGNTYDLVVGQKGLSEALVYGSWQNWAVAIFTLIVVMLLSNHGKGICKLASILLGMAAGYAVAAVMGMVDLSEISNAKWFSLPRFLHFGITFEPSACIALGLLFAINSIQAIGDLTATTIGGLNREPTDRELQGGIIAYGATNILTALFGGLPTATYSQNVGIVTTNKVVNRTVFALAGGFLLLAGVVPKFSAILTTIPQCVLGGATVTVFSTIAMTGMKLIASEGISPRNTTIVGLSAALGVGISQASTALSQFPEAVTVIFGKSPVVIATLLAIVLNLILPKENDKLTNAEPVDKPE